MPRLFWIALAVMGLAHFWTITSLNKVEGQLDGVIQLLKDLHHDEAIRACVNNPDEKLFPIKGAKRHSISFESRINSVTGHLIARFILYADDIFCIYYPAEKLASVGGPEP